MQPGAHAAVPSVDASRSQIGVYVAIELQPDAHAAVPSVETSRSQIGVYNADEMQPTGQLASPSVVASRSHWAPPVEVPVHVAATTDAVPVHVAGTSAAVPVHVGVTSQSAGVASMEPVVVVHTRLGVGSVVHCPHSLMQARDTAPWRLSTPRRIRLARASLHRTRIYDSTRTKGPRGFLALVLASRHTYRA